MAAPRTEASRIFDAAHFQELARIAERGKLDAVFFADTLAVGHRLEHNVTTVFEPITLLAAIAAVTERIGLIATASTGYNHPFTLARAFASLDHISDGRAGWNIVTSGGADEAANFGLDQIPEHGERYARAHEFLEAAVRLWDSWEDDAIVLDEASGTFAVPSRVHRVDHTGHRFTIRGRSTARGLRRAARCWFRQAPPRTASPSRPVGRRPCSPRSRPWRKASGSTPPSRAGSLPTAVPR